MKLFSGVLCLFILTALALQIPLTADTGGDFVYVPMAGYDLLRLSSAKTHSITAGGAKAGKKITFVGLYTRTIFDSAPAQDYPGACHGIELLLDINKNRHQVVSLLKSESDQPVCGGLETFQTAVVYGYEFIAGTRLHLALGGGLAVSDFGLESPVIPVPFVRLRYESPLLEAGFDFITGPNLDLTFFPQQRFRLNGEFRIDQFRDPRDLIFEASLEYRFFNDQSSVGDLAGVALGIKSDNLSFTSAEHSEVYELHYYAVFAELDLSFLSLSGGYAFDGRERYEDDYTVGAGDGYFISLSGLWQF
jgi:hypothetical protein